MSGIGSNTRIYADKATLDKVELFLRNFSDVATFSRRDDFIRVEDLACYDYYDFFKPHTELMLRFPEATLYSIELFDNCGRYSISVSPSGSSKITQESPRDNYFGECDEENEEDDEDEEDWDEAEYDEGENENWQAVLFGIVGKKGMRILQDMDPYLFHGVSKKYL